MKKKVMAISILAVFMLVAISYATAINTINTEKKESPLYGLRTRRAITEKIGAILENIKAKFLGNRIFLLPFQWLKNKPGDTPPNPNFYSKWDSCTEDVCCTEDISVCAAKACSAYYSCYEDC
jgi:hypothetical protein